LIRNGEEKLSSIDLGDYYWVDHTWHPGTTLWHGFQDINNILNAGEAGSNDLVDSKVAFRHWLWMTIAVFVCFLHWSTTDAKLKIIPIPEAPLEQGVTTNCGMLSVQQMKTETGSVICGTKTLVKKDDKWHSTPSVPCFPAFFLRRFQPFPVSKRCRISSPTTRLTGSLQTHGHGAQGSSFSRTVRDDGFAPIWSMNMLKFEQFIQSDFLLATAFVLTSGWEVDAPSTVWLRTSEPHIFTNYRSTAILAYIMISKCVV
jgi:hypothetical protein